MQPPPGESCLDSIEPYLDVEGILLLRSTCRAFRCHRFNKVHTLRFGSLRGFDPQVVAEKLLKQVLTCLSPSARAEGIVLDFSFCVLLRDTQLAWLTSSAPFFVPAPQRVYFTKLNSLRFDFCPHITDKGISALMSAHLPHLQRLSVRCVRSEYLTGEPFREGGLDGLLWPRFRHLNVDFTSVSLDALTTVAKFILDAEGGEKGSISFIGSWASKQYLDLMGAKHLVKALAVALNRGDADEVTRVAQRAQQEINNLLLTRLDTDPLATFALGKGSQLLVNVPVTCPTSEEGGINVWTLPVSVAVVNGNTEITEALLKAGADLDVIDHLGKSPLVRAVMNRNTEMTKFLLGEKVNLAPQIITGPSALNVAIEQRDTQLTRLLLERNYPLNLKCPAVKGWKSPLHVACETGDEELIHLLLDWGANPNSFSGSYKNSAVMLAYRANPRFLPVFLQGGPGGAFRSLPLAGEVLAAAVAKNDIRSVELLVALFPELLSRPHPTWSLPHIQAAKLGHVESLEALLAAYRLYQLSLRHSGPAASPRDQSLREHWYRNLLEADARWQPKATKIDAATRTDAASHKRSDCAQGATCTRQFEPCRHGKRRAAGEARLPKQARKASTAEVVAPGGSPGRRAPSRVSSKGSHRARPLPPHSTTQASTHPEGPARTPSAQRADASMSNPVRYMSLTIEPVAGDLKNGSNNRSSSKLRFWARRSSVASKAAGASDAMELPAEVKLPQGDTTVAVSRQSTLTFDNLQSDDILVTMTELLCAKDAQTGYTALHYAAEDGRVDCLRVLLGYGGNINILSSMGQSPLHAACNENREDVVKFLVRHGCRLEVRDSEHEETALMVCIRTRNDRLAKMLFKEIKNRGGFTPSTTYKARQTPLGYAIFFGRYSIAKLLLRVQSQVDAFFSDPDDQSIINIVHERHQSADSAACDRAKKVLKQILHLYETRISSGNVLVKSAEGDAVTTPSSGVGPPAMPSGMMITSRAVVSPLSESSPGSCSVDDSSGDRSSSSESGSLGTLISSLCSSPSSCGESSSSASDLCSICAEEEESSLAAAKDTKARRIQRRLKKAAKRPWANIFHRVKSESNSTAL